MGKNLKGKHSTISSQKQCIFVFIINSKHQSILIKLTCYEYVSRLFRTIKPWSYSYICLQLLAYRIWIQRGKASEVTLSQIRWIYIREYITMILLIERCIIWSFYWHILITFRGWVHIHYDKKIWKYCCQNL